MKSYGLNPLAFAAALLCLCWTKPASALQFTFIYDPQYNSYWKPEVKAQIEEAGKFLASYISNSHTVEITCVVNHSLGNGTFATGAPNGWVENSDSKSIANKGSIAFNPNSLSNVNQSSIVSLTIHELMHCLGVGASASFQAKVSGSNFTGAKTTSLNGGTQARISSAHFYQRDKDPKGVIPRISDWGGNLMSCLDLGILADVGYDVPAVASGQPMFVPVTINKMYAMSGGGGSIYVAMGGNDVIYAGATGAAMMAGLGGDDVLVTGGGAAQMWGDNGGGNAMGDAGTDIFYVKTNFQHTIYGLESRDKVYFDPSLGFTQAQLDAAPITATGGYTVIDGNAVEEYELEVGNFKLSIYAESMPSKTNMKVQSWSN